MIVKAKGNEIDLSSANNVDNASVVRIYNANSSSDAVITNDTANTSFTLPSGAITFVQKGFDDTLSSDVTVKAVSVAYNIS